MTAGALDPADAERIGVEQADQRRRARATPALISVLLISFRAKSTMSQNLASESNGSKLSGSDSGHCAE